MKIIILTGGSKIGKSTTITKNFRNWLIDQGAREIEKERQGTKEYEGVFQYKRKKIALHSSGDSYNLVVFAIAKYTHLDFLVLAGNTGISTIAKLVEVIKANKHHCVIKKKKAADKDNICACDKIIAEL